MGQGGSGGEHQAGIGATAFPPIFQNVHSAKSCQPANVPRYLLSRVGGRPRARRRLLSLRALSRSTKAAFGSVDFRVFSRNAARQKVTPNP
jgi:hypothetical protein